MLPVTNSIVVIILNSLLEKVRECTSQRNISDYVMCYSKFDEEVNAFIKVLTKWSLTRT